MKTSTRTTTSFRWLLALAAAIAAGRASTARARPAAIRRSGVIESWTFTLVSSQ